MIYILKSRLTENTYDLSKLCEQFVGKLEGTVTNTYLCCEWRSFIEPIPKGKQPVLVLNSGINALIYGGEIQKAKELYSVCTENGMKRNAYIEKRLMISYM